MEDKLINKILNFSDENICTAKELIITKEQAKEIIKELQEDYVSKAIIRREILGLDTQIAKCKYEKDDAEEYKKDMDKEKGKLLRSKTILEELLERKKDERNKV